MKQNCTLVCLALGAWLALGVGCGKNETPATSEKPAERTSQAPASEKAVAAPANPVATATEATRTTLDAATQATAAVVASAKEPAPNPTEGVRPAATGPTAPAGLAALSQDQLVQGLEEALAKGLQQAVARLGQNGGFLTNLNVKIPMPEKMQKVEQALRAMKQEKLADDFVTTMNHAAEQAVPEAGGVFADTLKQMTIDDAKSILAGPSDAATLYFQRTTQTNLYAKFYPIVQKATQKTGVTAAYKTLMEKANVVQGLGSLGSALSSSVLGQDSVDIDAYVTNKALEGLFKMVADEERQIRQSPVARTTDLLQKVFGAIRP